jgi:hypothetical protein
MPQVTVNKQKWEEAMEGLELSRELAKHVLGARFGIVWTFVAKLRLLVARRCNALQLPQKMWHSVAQM